MEIKVQLTKEKKPKPNENNLSFGQIYTDHMFVMDYEEGKGWYEAKIIPYGPLSLYPAARVLHYGQSVFEGLKAYRTKDNKINLFRPLDNFKRLNISDERLCIPYIDENFALKALKQLIKIDKDWIPSSPNTSLYIRPFTIATEEGLGVSPSKEYKFIIILSPSGSYYSEGLNPIKIFIEDDFVRAVRGGIGFTKASANYAISLKAQVKAKELGYSQVLWLDGVERKYIEEVGAMNVFFKINGEVITPSLEGSILPGITRDSVIEMLKNWGINVSERKISIDEIFESYKNGKLEEVFGTGTAAVISPVGELNYRGEKMIVTGDKIGEISQKLYNTLTGIQYGEIADIYNWIVEVD